MDDCQSTGRGRETDSPAAAAAGWRTAKVELLEDWARTLVRGPAGLCLLGTVLVLKLKALPPRNSPRVAGHPAGQSGDRTGIQGL